MPAPSKSNQQRSVTHRQNLWILLLLCNSPKNTLINLFLSPFSPGTAISVRGVNVVRISVRGDEDKYEGGRQRSFLKPPAAPLRSHSTQLKQPIRVEIRSLSSRRRKAGWPLGVKRHLRVQMGFYMKTSHGQNLLLRAC